MALHWYAEHERRESWQYIKKKTSGIKPYRHLGGPGEVIGGEGKRRTPECTGGQELCGRGNVWLSVSTIRK